MHDADPTAPRRPAAVRRAALFVLLAAAAAQAVGCHNLQEHRRARWNYGPGMSAGSDPYAGVLDLDAVETLV